jgi:hypothetical protein
MFLFQFLLYKIKQPELLIYIYELLLGDQKYSMSTCIHHNKSLLQPFHQENIKLAKISITYIYSLDYTIKELKKISYSWVKSETINFYKSRVGSIIVFEDDKYIDININSHCVFILD